MNSFSESDMDYSITMYLRQTWTDNRYKRGNTSSRGVVQLDFEDFKRAWIPDVYFVNEKKGAVCDNVPHRMYHIRTDGLVTYSTRLDVKLSCRMNLSKYPFDSQKCPVIIQSYGQTSDKIILRWLEVDPVMKDESLEMSQFSYGGSNTSDCTRGYNNFGNFSCIRADIHIKRSVAYYFTQIYIPSILIVILSWVSFWLNVEATPARISLGVLTILTLTTQATGLRTTLPKVSYIKALDVWLAACMTFLFGALLEFAIINVYSRGGSLLNDIGRRSRRLRSTKDRSIVDKETISQIKESGSIISSIAREKGLMRAYRIDEISRITFPVAFIIYNIVYWFYYLLY